MIFDTDIIIWIQRGNEKAGQLVDADENRCISIVSYMELLQNAQNKQQQIMVKNYIKELDFTILPLSEDIGHRALIYMEEYSLRYGISADDALIAATVIENNQTLVSGNSKHFKPIHELTFNKFQP
jgi:predicted nucleic acid-binding protein